MQNFELNDLPWLAESLVANPKTGASNVAKFVDWSKTSTQLPADVRESLMALISLKADNLAGLYSLVNKQLAAATDENRKRALAAVLEALRNHYVSKSRHHDLTSGDRTLLRKLNRPFGASGPAAVAE